ncbi:hypothetical protein [Bradyrhizobium sp. SZCCHNS3002]|uniref:hypothetical protein n=1 Tax=Bradyrhizobium sp. SZCCHNS3002 TaxID=3057310 RepID=UPI0028E196AB|nr:hypothetical protein [Bradyrhizobium sp. SZCCHNS3002]
MESASPEVRTPDRILFIHGTFAGRLPDQGDAWWQLGSKFSQLVTKVLRGLAIPSEEAFHWTGENSDVFRVFDAALLLERLRRENERGPFCVIAHSHGGMVLWHALMLSVERQIPLDNLRSWMTVGTPFIFYEARIGRVARHHLMAALIALFFSCLLAFHWYKSWLAVGLFALGELAAFSTCVLYLAVSSSRRLRSLEKETTQRLGSRWLGVRSKHDEAIALLRTALLLRTPIMPAWEDYPRWSYSQTGATEIPGRIPQQVWKRRGPSKEHPAFFLHPNKWLLKKQVRISGWRMHAREWVLRNILFWPFDMGLSLIRFGYNEFLANLLNGAAASAARSRLLGDDAPYFVAASVTDVPSRVQGLSSAELPREVDDELVRQANANATGLLADLRRNYISQLVLMHPGSILALPPSVSSDLTSTLVHCLYFEVESCQRLIAGALRHVFGGDVSRIQKDWTKQAHAATLKMTDAS